MFLKNNFFIFNDESGFGDASGWWPSLIRFGDEIFFIFSTTNPVLVIHPVGNGIFRFSMTNPVLPDLLRNCQFFLKLTMMIHLLPPPDFEIELEFRIF